jgi:hypothetical protein
MTFRSRQLLKPGVAVEKLLFCQNSLKFGG